ncbi:HlyD family secretion protein [Salmonella bongori]|uniref:HlyD family secretion protein n=1 Tax=Salmonella bongori TaxID=54736 RepID=UPI001558AC9B|nr:HlyD family efflux transporter periplasmic adaptor subunit [Salmonella bongori]
MKQKATSMMRNLQMYKGIFREEAVAYKKKQRSISPVSVPSTHVAFVACVIICLLIIFIMMTLEYTERVSVTGVTIPVKGVATVNAVSGGVISNLYVHHGDYVYKNQALFSINSVMKDSSGIQYTEIGIELLNKEKKTLEKELSSKYKSTKEQLLILNKELNKRRESLDILKKSLLLTENEIRREKPFYDKIIKLHPGGAVSDMEMNNIARNHFNLAIQAENYKKNINEEEQNILLLLNKKIKTYDDYNQTQTQYKKQIYDLNQKISAESDSQYYVITSTIEGYISGLTKTNGDSVSPHEKILTIIPDTREMVVYLFLDSSSIADVTCGGRVTIKYDSYPFQKYGVYQGVIKDIGRYPVDPSVIESSYGLKYSSPMYRITIQPDRNDVVYAQHSYLIPSGSHVHADILLDKKMLITWLFEPLIKFFKDNK